jgi:hypothetical protein
MTSSDDVQERITGFWSTIASQYEAHGGNVPAMQMRSTEPIVAMFEAAGFTDVTVSDLAKVHALAEDPPGTEPWYVVVGRRPDR